MQVVFFFIRLLVGFGNWLYFEKITILNRGFLAEKGPTIIVVNHPNCLTDVLLPAPFCGQNMAFLGNYSLFKNPIAGFLLRKFWSIPIQRPQDVDGKKLQNDEAFRACDDFLKLKKGKLFIAPEGTSFMERRIREVKTGTARIAFSAERQSNWQLGLKILPIGLVYSEPNGFRSRAWLNVGKPISVKRWKPDFEKDPIEATRNLSQFIEDEFQKLTIHCLKEGDEIYQRQLEAINSNGQIFGDEKQLFEAQRTWFHFKNDEKMRGATVSYFEKLEKNGLGDRSFSAVFQPQNFWKKVADSLFFAASAPLAAIGFLIWFLPCFLPFLLVKKLKLYIGYDSTVKFLVGLFTVPTMWFWVFKLSKIIDISHWFSMSCVFFTIPIGCLAWEFWKCGSLLFEDLKAHFFKERNVALADKMWLEREAIFQKITR